MCANTVLLVQLAVAEDNRMYARFLYDAMMFEMLPFWAPTAASALLVCAALLSVQVGSASSSLSAECVCHTNDDDGDVVCRYLAWYTGSCTGC